MTETRRRVSSMNRTAPCIALRFGGICHECPLGAKPWGRRFSLFCLCLMALCLALPLPAYAQAVKPVINPQLCDLAGGLNFQADVYADLVYFNESRENPVSLFQVWGYDEYGDEYREDKSNGTIPPGDVPGTASLEFHNIRHPWTNEILVEWALYPNAFTYVDSPVVDSMEPSEFSIGPDNRVVTLRGEGFPIKRPVEVWVGDTQAALMAPHPSLEFRHQLGQLIQFRPPPFPGGDYPLTVDVRVVTVGGGETVLEDAFTYDQLIPRITGFARQFYQAWRTGNTMGIALENFVAAPGIRVFFDDLEIEVACIGSECLTSSKFNVWLPSHPPGYVDVTIINPDGGSYTLEDGFRFTRSSPLHSADRNGDGVVSLSELLRVVQFYNEGGYRCAPEGVTTEDGFLPSPGAIPEDCRPHDSDLIDWDWQIDLSELLETIQLYNFGPYTLCADEVYFCPAE